MNDIRERDFRGLDLNLMVTLLVLLRERSVSRAAACLHLGQPAVSGALARLRDTFQDPLLVRGPGGMVPTARALALQATLAPAMAAIQATVAAEPAFDPRALRRTFVLGLPDWVDTWLLAPLLSLLAAEAPGVRLQVVATDAFQLAGMLGRQVMDLAIGAFGDGPAWMQATPLRSMRFCCMHGPGLPDDDSPWTLARYAALPHLMVTYRSALEGTVDKALARHGLSREILCTSPRFSSLPRVLQQVPAVATVPEVLAPLWTAAFGLVARPSPLELPVIDVRLTRHVARANDAGLQWVCDRVSALTDA